MNKEKIDAALKKLTEEAEKFGSDNDCMHYLSEYLMNKVTSDESADRILDESKSLKGLEKQIKDIARCKAKDNWACLDNTKVEAVADEYFGLSYSSSSTTNILDVTDYL